MAPEERPPVFGWLMAVHAPGGVSPGAVSPGPLWPGVLLHRDALLVRAPREVLVKSVGDLQVVIQGGANVHRAGSADGLQNAPLPGDPLLDAQSSHPLPTRAVLVQTVNVLEVDGWPDDPATAMVRLSEDSGINVSTHVNRSGFDVAVRVTGDVWRAFQSLGLVPDDLDARPLPTNPLPTSRPAVTQKISIQTVTVQPASWCDIFWWLC